MGFLISADDGFSTGRGTIMPRPNKAKKIGKVPVCRHFTTEDSVRDKGLELVMSIEEFESVRLIDYLGLTQAEAALRMAVGRGTVQSLYTSARRKIARYLVEGSCLKISGGNYAVDAPVAAAREDLYADSSLWKGDFNMKVAVTYENGQVFQHFGHTSQFKLYTIEDGKIADTMIVDTNGSGHGALAGFLKAYDIETLICGGIGAGAKNALAEMGIELFAGAVGDADAQVESFLAGNLVYDPNTECHHHGEGHHGEGHHGGCGHHSEGHHGGCGHHSEGHHGDCGHHGEGNHDCGSHGAGQGCN